MSRRTLSAQLLRRYVVAALLLMLAFWIVQHTADVSRRRGDGRILRAQQERLRTGDSLR